MVKSEMQGKKTMQFTDTKENIGEENLYRNICKNNNVLWHRCGIQILKI